MSDNAHPYLRKDVDRLVARATEAVGQNVAGIAILHTIVVEAAAVILSARSGVGSLVQIAFSHRYAGRGDNGNAVMDGVDVGTRLSTSCIRNRCEDTTVKFLKTRVEDERQV
jgi:hypothetical protein